MRQVWITKAGPPEVLRLREAPDPLPGRGRRSGRCCRSRDEKGERSASALSATIFGLSFARIGLPVGGRGNDAPD